MKLFMKEHLGLILLQCIQSALIGGILVLSGFRHYSILLYTLFVSSILLVAYLVFNYYNRRHVYEKLTHQARDLKGLLEKTDISPIGDALDRLTKTNYQLFMSRLKEAEDDQSNHLKFIDRWVHQMKTPLSVIELSAQELDEPESSNIREETDRLKNGLNTVLYMARLRTIQEDFQIKPVTLEKIVREVNQSNKRLYIRNNVYPHVNAQNSLTVESDEKWLYFIINQLLQNAVKYTAGRSKRIDIKLFVRAGAAVLEVTDFGVGIPVHDQKRLFQAFYTGDNGRKFRESTGMGLYLMKEVVDYLGHKIEIDSEVNTGTTFRIGFTKTQTLSNHLT